MTVVRVIGHFPIIPLKNSMAKRFGSHNMTVLYPNSCFSDRVLTNSKFGLFYSNFLIPTPTFSKVQKEKYGKTPNFSGKQHFYSYFQNPGENSE